MASLLAGLAASFLPIFAQGAKKVCPKSAKPDLALQLPPLGEVKLWLHRAPKDAPQAVVVACDGQGRLLRRLKLTQEIPGALAARKYDVPGWPSPVLAITSSWARADGISAEEVLLTVAQGQLTEVLPNRILDFQDAVCLGTASQDSRPTVDLIESYTGNQCFMCWPKRFQATTLVWDGSKLVRQSKRMTRHKHKDWQSALRELHWSCPAEVFEATVQPDE